MDFYKKIKKHRLVAAHRGYRAVRPENTLSAFEAAMGEFDFIELDVQPSSDGRLMILHDDTLERTTDIEYKFTDPRPNRLIDYDFDILRRLDAGSWFEQRDPFSSIAEGIVSKEDISPQQIPTLDEALRLCAKHDMPLNIEIKDSPLYDEDKLLSDILQTIHPYWDSIPILISSFNYRYLKKLHILDPSLSLAANVEHTHPPDLTEYLKELGVCGYHVDEPIANTAPLKALENAGITCAVFTVNEHDRQQKLFDMGYRAVFADHPADYRVGVRQRRKKR